MGKYFYCYSRPLKVFLIENGLRYILYARHPATMKRYWVFESSIQLNMLLEKWRNQKDVSAFLIEENERKEEI